MTPTTLPCSAGAVQSYHSNYGLREGKSLKRTLQTGPCLVSLARSYHKGKTSCLGFCKYNLPWVRKVGSRQFVVGESKCAYTAAVETEEAVDGASALDVATAVDAAPALSPEDEKLETDTGIGATPDNGDQANKKRAIKRPVRKITVKNEELIVGSVFTGIVKSIQPWGAFINIGAFADGLVHISKAGEGFVRNMEDVVKIGQEVKVKVIEVDMEQRRIKLSIKDVEKEGQTEPASERASSSRWGTGETATQRPRVQGRGSQVRQPAKQKPTTKFQKGQTVTGVVKNLTRRGGFVQLPGGEEGFLHSAEITPGGEDLPIENLLQVGQEVSVRILRITEGRLNLSMKTEVDLKKMNAAINDNEEAWATNPFELAFRKNPVIKQYLDETKKNTNTAETTEKLDGDVDQAKSSGSELKVENKEILAETSADEKSVELSNVTGIPSLESAQESQNVEESINSSDEEGLLEDSARVENTTMTEEETTEVDQSVDDNVYGKDEIREAEIENALESGEVESGDAILSDDKSKQPDAAVSEITAKLDEADEKLMGEVGRGDSGAAAEVSEKTPTEEDKAKGVDTAVSESSTELDEAAEKLSATATAVSAALVKQLREETGAGMMDCKKALTETGGNIERAYEYLRKKGLAGAEKKASRLASEGAVGSYIHDGRIGVLLEVNCETDFVSRGEIFKQLVDDLSMQIAANQQVAYVAVEDIPQELKDKEWAIEMEREDLQTKPEQVRVKIVEGRITKRLGDLALLEQPFIKDDKVLVKDLIKQTVVTVGENIRVRRFARYVLGEGLEKREHDFVAEVAAQTKPKESIQGTSVEVKTDAAKETMDEGSAETANGPSDIVISAAIVKQLREETGTGMMDCKKALLDTGGDYEKAREYLRKKGLASADKKASRVAAEGAVGSYIHDSRIGVLIEVNSETDFVARGEIFKQLLEDLAMQVVANPQVQFISVDDIPSDVRQKERELEMQREDLLSKPEQIREKIVDGRMSKRLGDLCLLEQPFIKDDSILVRDLIKQTIASIGENLKVRRFVRFTLGEGLEKKSQNFAAEVAAQIKG